MMRVDGMSLLANNLFAPQFNHSSRFSEITVIARCKIQRFTVSCLLKKRGTITRTADLLSCMRILY